MRAVDLIEKKKNGLEHTKEEIYFLVENYMKGLIEDYQMSAWLMAVCFQGLTDNETAYLTKSFVDSGEVLDFSHIAKHIADKHSTGGVGDKVTLVLAPILASLGVYTAKLSGRGLGFTGGTVDKLESIPNFKCELSKEEFFNQIKNVHVAISSQSPNLTPADGKIYSLGRIAPSRVSNIYAQIYYDKTLTDAAGVGEIKTVDDFYEALKLVKEAYPDKKPLACTFDAEPAYKIDTVNT